MRRQSQLPASFKVMLHGFGSSENNRDSIYVQTLKQGALGVMLDRGGAENEDSVNSRFDKPVPLP